MFHEMFHDHELERNRGTKLERNATGTKPERIAPKGGQFRSVRISFHAISFRSQMAVDKSGAGWLA